MKNASLLPLLALLFALIGGVLAATQQAWAVVLVAVSVVILVAVLLF